MSKTSSLGKPRPKLTETISPKKIGTVFTPNAYGENSA